MSGTEFTELGALGEYVEDRDQDLVSNRHCGPLGAQPRLETVVLLLVVGAFRLGGAHRRSKQRRLEIKIALARARLARPAGALMIAGADASPGGEPAGVAEHRHVDADLRDDRHGDPVVNTGDLPAQAPLRLVGPSLLNTLVERARRSASIASTRRR